MRSRYRTNLLLFICMAFTPAYAQSTFDGFRVGIEAIYSETSFRVDASRPKEVALANTRGNVLQGEAQLAAATAQLSEQRASSTAETRALAQGQQRLLALEQQAAANPPAAATLAPQIAELRRETAAGAVLLQTRSVAIAAGDQAAEAGRIRLAEGNRMAAEISALPAVTASAFFGTSVRVSLGWGSSWAIGMGRIHLGTEIDAAPGTGNTVTRVPTGYDTRVLPGPIFGASARIGWIPVPWAMPYAAAGVETQQLRIEHGMTRSRQQFTGFRMGVGVEFSVSENNIFRLGYDHTITSDINFAGARVTPTRNTYRIGFVRRF